MPCQPPPPPFSTVALISSGSPSSPISSPHRPRTPYASAAAARSPRHRYSRSASLRSIDPLFYFPKISDLFLRSSILESVFAVVHSDSGIRNLPNFGVIWFVLCSDAMGWFKVIWFVVMRWDGLVTRMWRLILFVHGMCPPKLLWCNKWNSLFFFCNKSEAQMMRWTLLTTGHEREPMYK